MRSKGGTYFGRSGDFFLPRFVLSPFVLHRWAKNVGLWWTGLIFCITSLPFCPQGRVLISVSDKSLWLTRFFGESESEGVFKCVPRSTGEAHGSGAGQAGKPSSPPLIAGPQVCHLFAHSRRLAMSEDRVALCISSQHTFRRWEMMPSCDTTAVLLLHLETGRAIYVTGCEGAGTESYPQAFLVHLAFVMLRCSHEQPGVSLAFMSWCHRTKTENTPVPA